MRKPCCNKNDTNKGAWSKQEDQKLIDYIRKHGEGNWRFIPKAAGLLRCGKSCRLRWINYLRPDLKRGNFGEDEEDLIFRLHHLLGNRWSLIAGRLPGRTDNEVKNYWNSHLKKKLISKGIDPNKRCKARRQSCVTNNHKVSKPYASAPDHQPSVLPDLNLTLGLCNRADENIDGTGRSPTLRLFIWSEAWLPYTIVRNRDIFVSRYLVIIMAIFTT